MDKEDKLVEFDPKYPHTLPEDWKNKLTPTVYEVLATSNTPVSYTHLTLPTKA